MQGLCITGWFDIELHAYMHRRNRCVLDQVGTGGWKYDRVLDYLLVLVEIKIRRCLLIPKSGIIQHHRYCDAVRY
jgi:hypothetical protein